MNTSTLRPLIDCDLIKYRVGFACKDDEPLENCLHSVKLTLEGIKSNFDECEKDPILYVSGTGNFRDEVATIKKYKGNREGAPKPKYFNEIHEYLTKVHGAIEINGMEPDDAQGIEQWANKDKSTCIVSIDKDMKMIPGWHYNWVKKEFTYIPLSAANRFFWWQMLVGDPTDNIPGVKGVGPKRADKMLPELIDNQSARKTVEDQYKRAYGPAMWEAVFHEVATLLWILRKEGTTYKDYV